MSPKDRMNGLKARLVQRIADRRIARSERAHRRAVGGGESSAFSPGFDEATRIRPQETMGRRR